MMPIFFVAWRDYTREKWSSIILEVNSTRSNVIEILKILVSCHIYGLDLVFLTKNRVNIAILSAVDPSIFHMSTGKTLKFFKSDTHDPYFFPFFEYWPLCFIPLCFILRVVAFIDSLKCCYVKGKSWISQKRLAIKFCSTANSLHWRLNERRNMVWLIVFDLRPTCG